MASRENLFERDPDVKSFTDGNHFRQDQIVHAEKKSFNCDACEKSFTNECDLKRHLRILTREGNHTNVILLEKILP